MSINPVLDDFLVRVRQSGAVLKPQPAALLSMAEADKYRPAVYLRRTTNKLT